MVIHILQQRSRCLPCCGLHLFPAAVFDPQVEGFGVDVDKVGDLGTGSVGMEKEVSCGLFFVVVCFHRIIIKSKVKTYLPAGRVKTKK